MILGAGIAGLAAAYELTKVGYSVTILEARERSGGRNWTVRGGDRETEQLSPGSDLDGYLTPPGAGSQQGVVDLPYGLSALLQSRVGLNFAFEFGWDQAMLMFQPVGGMDAIPKAFETALRGKVKMIYGAKVSGIYNNPDGVSVTYADGSARGKQIDRAYCICTIPPQIVKRVPSNFAPAVQTALGVPVPVTSTSCKVSA